MRCAGKCTALSPTSPAHLSITGQEVTFLGRTHVTLIIGIGCCCFNRVRAPLGWTLALQQGALPNYFRNSEVAYRSQPASLLLGEIPNIN